MDTNINNYSVAEIQHFLKIKDCDLNTLFLVITESIDQLKVTNTLASNKETFIGFFRQCFYKLCRFYQYQPSAYMQKTIDGPNEPYQKEEVQFIGALPTKMPETVAATVSSTIDQYARGVVNPLQRETVNTILTINSKFRDYTKQSTSTDFSVVLTEPMNNVIALKMASLELMNSYYSISAYLKTNLFTVETYKINTTTGAVTDLYTKEIELSEGSYTSDVMVAGLNALLMADPSLNMVTTVYNSLKGRIYFKLNATPPVPPPAGTTYGFNLDFILSADETRPLFLNLGWMLGFTKASYMFDTDYITAATPTQEIGFNPESPLDFTGTKFFLLEVTDYNNNSPAVLKYNTNDRHWFNVKDILAKIPNISPAYSVIFEDSSDRIFKTRKYFGPVKLQKLRIRLLDENGKVVDLNGSELVVSFDVESLDVPYKNKV
jgi:hypothetical protein